MSCCDFDNDIYDNKIKKLENNLKNFEKEQNKTNAEIYTLLKQSGVDLSQYYALNEDDYTKTLTSEDDVNTLEPGTYKIVKTDMPQNAPTGIASSQYDGTLILSNSYAILFENGFLHIGNLLTGINKFKWNYVINSNLINIHLQSYMLISKYSDGEFIDDIHTLNQSSTGVYIVNSATQNLPVQQNGIIIVRIGTATNSLFVTFIPEDSFDVYYCAKKANGTWTEWGQVAFMSDVPSLEGYATQEWVNEQISEITGGAVTTDIVSQMISDAISGYATENWVTGKGYQTASQVASAITAALTNYVTRTYVKENYLSIEKDLYESIPANSDLNNYITKGNYGCFLSVNVPSIQNKPISLKYAFKLVVEEIVASDQLIQKITENSTGNIYYRTYSGGNWGNWITKGVMSVFNTFDQLGITDLPCTTLDIFKALPNDSIAILGTDRTTGISDLPSISGVLEITKTSNKYRYTIVFYESAGRIIPTIRNMWLGETNDNNDLLRWEKIAVESDNPSLNNYATQEWVNSQGFLTEIPDEYVTSSELQAQNYATQSWVTEKGYQTSTQVSSAITKALNGYATQTWVNQQNFAHESDIPSLSGYATQSWINDQNFATEEWVGQQGYQTVQQVNSLISTATADMLTQEDLETFNYATENWVLQTALAGYAKTTIDDSLATRPSQEFDRFMIRSTDYHGVNAVSGAEGYLVMHMAVDPDSPTKFIRSSGIVSNNKYVNTFSTSDESSVGLSTNNEGTVTVVGMSNNAKQMFILVKPDNME